MQNLKFSDYNISVLNKKGTKYNVIHGYLGNFDNLDYGIGNKIHNKNMEILNESKETIEYLLQRGYLCSETKNEEDWMKNVGNILHKKISDKYSISIIPTYNCNFRCPYCFEKKNSCSNPSIINVISKNMVDQIYLAIENLDSEIDSNICLFGGEPLLKENYEIVKYIVEKGNECGYRFYASSNGYDLDSFDDLLDQEKIFMVQITLDGTEAYHDSMRYLEGKGTTFRKIVSNINQQLEKNVQISVRTNVSKGNLDELEKLIKFYTNEGWIGNNNFKFYFSPLDDCSNIDESNTFSHEDILTYIRNLNNLNVNPIESVGIYSNIYNRIRKYLNANQLILLQAETCYSNRRGIYIDPSGKLFTCCNLVGTEHSCGKIHNNSFDLTDTFKQWNDRTISNMEDCSKCAYALFCGGGCTAKAVRNEKDLKIGICGNIKQIIDECISSI